MYRTLALISALLLTQIAAAPEDGFVVTLGPNGELTATLYTAGAIGKFEYFANGDNCSETTAPCFGFLAANGTEPVKTTGPNCNDAGYCAVAGVKTVRVVLPKGGTFSTSCGDGCHAGDCFSSLTVQPRGGSDGVYIVNVNDGCAETVVCGAGTGTVEIDKQDVVKSCEMVTRH